MTTLEQIIEKYWAKDMMGCYFEDVEKSVKEWLQQKRLEPVGNCPICQEIKIINSFIDRLLKDLRTKK